MLASRIPAALSLPFLLASVVAQSVPHTSTMPKIAEGALAGSGSTFPLGRTGGRVQYWYRGDNIPSTPQVTSIGARPFFDGATTGRTQTFQITMANVTIGASAFTRDFAQNLGAQPTVVFASRSVALPALPTGRDPNVSAVWMTLDAPFTMNGPNVIVDFDLGTAVGAAGAPPLTEQWVMTARDTERHLSSGVSCGVPLLGPARGAIYRLTLNGVPPSQPVWFLFGSDASVAGGVRLPASLAFAGMPGCFLGVDPAVVLPVVADWQGNATYHDPRFLQSPGESLIVYAQAIHAVSGTPTRLATTNVIRSAFGGIGLCNTISNVSIDGAIAQNGPFDGSSAAVLLFRP